MKTFKDYLEMTQNNTVKDEQQEEVTRDDIIDFVDAHYKNIVDSIRNDGGRWSENDDEPLWQAYADMFGYDELEDEVREWKKENK